MDGGIDEEDEGGCELSNGDTGGEALCWENVVISGVIETCGEETVVGIEVSNEE